ncbi:hypothetical protein RSJ42_04500 [Methanosarcina hadiensis]|uniref:hypothetical protein n=1 Tax=Methanosarcina hadiensis TaxID=3078083 RepID=UPI003977C87D
MTINKTVSALCFSEIVLELKVIKAVFEPPVQAIKATATPKAVTRCRSVKAQGQISGDIPTTCKKGIK